MLKDVASQTRARSVHLGTWKFAFSAQHAPGLHLILDSCMTKTSFVFQGAVGWLASDEAKEEYDDDYIFMCGSTLISENFALTASHCASAPSGNKLVRPGASRPKIVRFGVEKLYVSSQVRTPVLINR